MPGRTRRQPSHPLTGTWSCSEDGESNLEITISAKGAQLKVQARDAFDGEAMKISRVSWDGRALRFRTTTPSTKALLDHELVAGTRDQATYRCTVTQKWMRMPEEDARGGEPPSS